MGRDFPSNLASVNLLNISWPFDFGLELPTDGVLLLCVDGYARNRFIDSGGLGLNYTWSIPMSLEATAGTFSWYTPALPYDCVKLNPRFAHFLRVSLHYVSNGVLASLPPCPEDKRCSLEIGVV